MKVLGACMLIKSKFKYRIAPALLSLLLLGWLVFNNQGVRIGDTIAWAGNRPGLVNKTAARRAKVQSIAQRFLGEKLDYHLGVFLFSHVADCVISFQQDDASGQYKATMWAKTRGVVGWLTDYRENRYVSYMEETPDGRYLRPLQFERAVTIGNFIDQSFSWFDYEASRIDYAIVRNHRTVSQNCYDIPEGTTYHDILSAFYNFRAGAFGNIQRGKKYWIPSIPDKGIDKYIVDVLNNKQEKKQRSRQGWDDAPGMVMRIKVDKDIFGTKEGLLWALMSEDLVPLEGIAEDAIGMGDIIGKLNQISYTSP